MRNLNFNFLQICFDEISNISSLENLFSTFMIKTRVRLSRFVACLWVRVWGIILPDGAYVFGIGLAKCFGIRAYGPHQTFLFFTTPRGGSRKNSASKRLDAKLPSLYKQWHAPSPYDINQLNNFRTENKFFLLNKNSVIKK